MRVTITKVANGYEVAPERQQVSCVSDTDVFVFQTFGAMCNHLKKTMADDSRSK